MAGIPERQCFPKNLGEALGKHAPKRRARSLPAASAGHPGGRRGLQISATRQQSMARGGKAADNHLPVSAVSGAAHGRAQNQSGRS
jgi:hypothetical protein